MSERDLRRKRTQLNLENALLKLLKKKSLYKIQIKELTELAMVSRQTFYLHYETIEELYEDCVVRILDEIHEDMTDLEALSDPSKTELERIIEAFKIYYNHAEALKALLAVADKDLFINSISKYELVHIFHEEIYEDKLLKKYATLNFAGGFYVMLREWMLGKDDMGPEEFAALYQKVMRSVKPQ